MEELIALLLVVAGGWLFAIVISILALRRVRALSDTVKELQKTVKAQSVRTAAVVAPPPAAEPEEALPELTRVFSQPLPQPLPQPLAAAAKPVAPQPPATPKAKPVPPASPSVFDELLARGKAWLLGGNTVLRVGVVILFIGLAFLLRFASEHYSPPVELRYIAVAIVGMVLLLLGWQLKSKKPDYALLIQGTGIAVLYLTVFTAYKLHHLLPAVLTMTLMVVLTAAAVVLAVVQNAPWLAYAASLGGFAAPILASSGSGNHVALFTYFALLNLGILTISWFKSWRVLNLLGFFCTFGIGLAWGLRSYNESLWGSTQPFLLFFFLLYVAVALFFARRRWLELDAPGTTSDTATLLLRSFKETHYLDGTLLLGVPVIAFGLQCSIVRSFEFAMAYSALALAFFYIALAFALRQQRALRLLVEVFLSLGVIFASLAIPLALSAKWTASAWALEAAGLYWLGWQQGRRLSRVFALLLIVGATLAFLYDLLPGVATLLSDSAMAALLLAAAYLFCHRALRLAPSAAPQFNWEARLALPFAIGGWTFLLLIPALLFDLPPTLMVWALTALLAVLQGYRLRLERFIGISVAIQLLTGMAFFFALNHINLYDAEQSHWQWRMLCEADFVIPVLLSLIALLSSYLLRLLPVTIDVPELAVWFRYRSPLLLVIGLFWWVGCVMEQSWFFTGQRLSTALIILSLSAWLWLTLARRLNWPHLASACLFPLALAFFYLPIKETLHFSPHPLTTWSLLLVTHILVLNFAKQLLPARILQLAHICGCWLFLALLMLILDSLALAWSLSTAWRWLLLALLPSLFLLAMSRPVAKIAFLRNYSFQYGVLAAIPVAATLVLAFLYANFSADGNAAPLIWIPLINPLEVALFIVLLATTAWALKRLPELMNNERQLITQTVRATAAVLLLALLTMSVCRSVHHWTGIAFTAPALSGSMVVQASWSILWTVAALALMIGGNRRKSRMLWKAGAFLIAVVVLKLFFVELSNTGSVARIVSFIGVGALLLIVGYFSPLPARNNHSTTESTS